MVQVTTTKKWLQKLSVWNDSSESLRFTIYSFITLCYVDGLIKYCIHEGFASLMDKISISIRNRKTQRNWLLVWLTFDLQTSALHMDTPPAKLMGKELFRPWTSDKIILFWYEYLTESLYIMLMVSPNGRPPKDSWGLNAYSKDA